MKNYLKDVNLRESCPNLIVKKSFSKYKYKVLIVLVWTVELPANICNKVFQECREGVR